VVVTWSTGASARDLVLPAGTILQCILNEPNFSKATVEVGDPVLCNLRGVAEFGEQIFPRGSYLVGHLESAKDPGHFFGKGNLKLQFDRLGLPSGDVPLNAKLIAVRGYKVDREGKIDGKGHAKRDVAEWILPPLWPWKVIMLPARGPRPKLKGETALKLRLLDDVLIPQVSNASERQQVSNTPERQQLARPQRESFRENPADDPPTVSQTYGPGWHFFGPPPVASYLPPPVASYVPPPVASYVDPQTRAPGLTVRDLPPNQITVPVPGSPYPGFAGDPAAPAPAAPTSLSLFVMKTGTLVTLYDCTFQDGRISYALPNGGVGVISSEDVDWKSTMRFNAEHGLRITLRGTSISSDPARSGS
jgi:hypothetical protein